MRTQPKVPKCARLSAAVAMSDDVFIASKSLAQLGGWESRGFRRSFPHYGVFLCEEGASQELPVHFRAFEHLEAMWA